MSYENVVNNVGGMAEVTAVIWNTLVKNGIPDIHATALTMNLLRYIFKTPSEFETDS